MIVNGDFENGDRDFRTQYELSPSKMYGGGFTSVKVHMQLHQILKTIIVYFSLQRQNKYEGKSDAYKWCDC
ncbi:MAG: hypothetical protein IPL23_26850 [Saprospiraceae bacterium]|nr:hypothetical protein [Saprospiraceae bacterium]